eukprot:jgi/Mesen1/4971/ME000248S04259
MMRTDIPPNQSIYINNLNEKINKEELKKSLYAVFSQFGKILDIVAAKSLKLRGQAWVVFDDVTAATNALRQMQGFPFYDKPMRISYARQESDAVAKAKGTFVPKDKKKKAADKARQRQEAQQAATQAEAPFMAPYGGAPPAAETTYAAPPRPVVPEAPAPPNNLLFVQSLPIDRTKELLVQLFQQFPGFQDVRLIDAKPDICFVEFGDENQATIAMSGLQGFKLTPTNPMNITYARK